MDVLPWLYMILFGLGAPAGAYIKEGGHERVGGAIQYIVLAFLFWQAYESKHSGDIDLAMAFGFFSGMMLMGIQWSNVALKHRRFAHKDQPDKSWTEIFEEFRDELLSTIAALVFLGLIIWGLFWLGSKFFR